MKVDGRILAFERTLMLSSFLKTNASNWHGHYHQKSLLSMSDEVGLLRPTGAQVSYSMQAAAAWLDPSDLKRTNMALHLADVLAGERPFYGR